MIKRITFIVFCALFYLLASAIFAEFSRADDYTISSNSTSTNGGNTINGSDSLTLSTGVTITTSSGNEGIDASGESNTITQSGNISTSGTSAYGIRLQDNSNILDVSGTIITNGVQAYGIYLQSSDSNTIIQSGKVTTQNYTSRLYMIEDSVNNNITQSGDLESTGVKWSHAYYLNNADSNTITQTGNITTAGTAARSHGYFFDDVSDASGSDNNIIIQKGNITLTENTNKAYYCEQGTNNSITQSGTITTSGTDGHGYHFKENCDSNTITLSGTISVSGTDAKAIKVESGNDANTLVLSEEPTITGNVDLGSEDFTISLSCNLKKDLTVTLDNKTGMTVTNNLCGNDTYEILDSSLAADADNSETNGYLRILAEDLDTPNENAKYRGENVLTKLRGLFTAADHINWNAPEEKFFKIFHSYQKREGIYDGQMSGVVGQLNPFNWGALRSNVFVGYTKQYGDFYNGEYLGGDNFALGLKNVYENNGFRASFTPMFGFNDLTITDYETDTKTSINTNILSEFAGINTKFTKEVELSKEGTLDLSVQTTYGVQKFPDYVAIFADGDLSVKESIEQVLGVGFAVKYSDDIGKGFIIQPYAGVNINNNFNDNIKITADSENNNKSPANSETSGYYAGVSLTKEVEGMNFDLDLMYGNEDGLINQIAAVSLTKSFGKVKTAVFDVRDVRKKPDFQKVDESLTTQDYNKDLKKSENKIQKFKKLALKTMQENQISKHLIKELLIENQRLKTIVEMFKNKERQNKNALEESKQSKLDKLILYNFLFAFFTITFASTWLTGFLYNKIVFRASKQTLTA